MTDPDSIELSEVMGAMLPSPMVVTVTVTVTTTLARHVYAVNPALVIDLYETTTALVMPTPATASLVSTSNPSATGVRREILQAIAAVVTRSGGPVLALTDILVEMRGRGTN